LLNLVGVWSEGYHVALMLAINRQLHRWSALPTPHVQLRPFIFVADAHAGDAMKILLTARCGDTGQSIM